MSSYLRVGALVEITPTADGIVPESLLSLAYRASENALIVLAHRGVTARQIDHVLDRIVATYGLRTNGVIYADATNVGATIDMAHRARVVIAATPAFQEVLAEAGISFFRVSDAPEALEQVRGAAAEASPAQLVPARSAAWQAHAAT